MKRLLGMLLILFIIYLGIQYLFVILEKGQSEEYILKSDKIEFKIEEVSNFESGSSNYFFGIKFNDKRVSFQVNHDYNKISTIIKEIKYYKDSSYECLLPIFKDDLILTDMMCFYDNQLTYYYNLKGKSPNLDQFVKEIKTYKKDQFVETTEYKTVGKVAIYKNNLIDNHYIGLTSYKGIFNISNEFNSLIYNITLFNNDIYNQKLGVFIDKYYLVADYNKKFEFHEFNLINIITLETSTITSNVPISLDSYIQGVSGDKVYLYDKDNKVQYEINVNKKTIVSNNTINHYDKGVWSTISIAEANNELKFVYQDSDYKNNEYQRIDKVGNNTGYYYLYKKNNNNYDVYRINIQDKEGLIYLFSTQTIDNIYYVDDYVYFIDENKIKVFNTEFGLKTLVEYNELQFNKNINFSIYVK